MLGFTEVDEYVVKAQVHAGGRGKGTFNTGVIINYQLLLI